MNTGCVVEFNNTGRLGYVTKIKEDLIEVRLFSGSTIVAPKKYFNLVIDSMEESNHEA